MKKLILVATLAVSALTFAQEKIQKNKKMTTEQRTELQVKKMTLDLDLDAKQQKDIKALLIEEDEKREKKMAEMKAKKEKGEKPLTDEKFEIKNKILDNQIEHKAQMKKILRPEQFQKWEQNIEKRKEKIKKRKSFQQKEK